MVTPEEEQHVHSQESQQPQGSQQPQESQQSQESDLIEARQQRLLQPLPSAAILPPGKLEEAKRIIENDKAIKPFWVKKYKNEAAKNWNKFYQRNETRFYKDRHWIEREFTIYKEGASRKEDENESHTMTCLEVGCGVGNFVFPVLDKNPHLFMYACDFAPHAVELVKKHEDYAKGRCSAFVCDLTKDPLTDTIPKDSLDVISVIFVLSAIPAEKLEAAIKNIKEVLKPGGMICFRDYAIYDAAQIKFSSNPGHMLDTNLYVRQDGTLSLFFSVAQIQALFEAEGFETVECDYVHRETINRALDINLDRRFLQAKFVKK